MPQHRCVVLPLLLAGACATTPATTEPASTPPAPAPAVATDPAPDPSLAPDTPAGRRIAEIVEFLAAWSGDVAEAETFVGATLAPEFRDQFPMEAHVEFLSTVARDFPQPKLAQVSISEDTELLAYVQSTENQEWLEITLAVSPEAPHQVTSLRASPSGEPPSPQTLALIDGELTHEALVAIVELIAERLAEDYVEPDVAAKAGRAIRDAVSAGEYDDVPDRTRLAERLTTDLQAVAHDRHLRVRSLDELRKPPPGSPDEPAPDPVPPHGFVEAKILPGNIGYVDLRFFAPPEVAKDAADSAMKTVEGAGALVFDMRRNGGGDPRGVQYLCSFLFDQRTHLNSLYWRAGERTEEFWTLDDVGGRRRPKVPVFVLTSSDTFSGAEEFTYNLKMQQRATIVGETTGGGANPGGSQQIGTRLQIFVPIGKAINPISGTNWEGVGVKPDVEVEAAGALDEALKLARRKRRRKPRS